MPTPRKHESAAACQAAYRKRQAETRRLEQQRKGLPTLPAIPAMPGTARWDKIVKSRCVRTSESRCGPYHPVRVSVRTTCE